LHQGVQLHTLMCYIIYMMSIRKKFAFTIIEVLVVVAIIGTLIAIGLNE